MREVMCSRIVGLLFSTSVALVGCGGKPPPKVEAPNESASPVPGEEKKEKVSCTGTELELLSALIQSACEVPNAKPDAKTLEPKGLEISVKPSQGEAKVAAGKSIEFVLTYKNKTANPFPLEFVLDPEPRFVVEAYDEKGTKRIDQPSGPPPKANVQERSTNQGTGRITLLPDGTASVKVHWTASRMRWAPEKLKGSIPGEGFPKAPAGPLAKGKYMLRVVSPIANLTDNEQQEITAPKVLIEVTK